MQTQPIPVLVEAVNNFHMINNTFKDRMLTTENQHCNDPKILELQTIHQQ